MTDALTVWTNHTDTVVARDLADVQVVVEEHYGCTFEQEGWTLDEWEQISGDTPVTICNIHDRGVDDKLTKTASQWAADSGRGFLCSTEW